MERRYGPNRTSLHGDYAVVELEDAFGNTAGAVTIDAPDILLVASYGRWHIGSGSYAVSEGGILTGPQTTLERLLLHVPKATKTRHVNGDKTDYRRANLNVLFDKRVTPKRQNGTPNTHTVDGLVASIRLSNRFNELVATTLIDIEDLERVLDYGRWWKSSKPNSLTLYASSDGRKETGRVKMHRFIMQAQGKLQIDHINGNGLDNRRSNLRFVTDTENQQNRPKANKNNSSSGIKNVYFHKASGRWVVLIIVEGKRWSGGYFATQVEAETKAAEMREELHTHSPENRDIGVL